MYQYKNIFSFFFEIYFNFTLLIIFSYRNEKKETYIYIIILFFPNCSPCILKKKLCAIKIFERIIIILYYNIKFDINFLFL